MQNHRVPPSATLAATTLLLLSLGCATNPSSDSFTLPDYTILSGSVTENSDGSISVPVDGGATIALDDPISGDSARMTVTGRFDGTHLTFRLFGDSALDGDFEVFMLRSDQNELFMNIIHPDGYMGNVTLPGPYMLGDDFTIRSEVVNQSGMVRFRVWAPGDAFTDTPAFDSDDYEVITPWAVSTGTMAGLGIIGATIRSIGIDPVP